MLDTKDQMYTYPERWDIASRSPCKRCHIAVTRLPNLLMIKRQRKLEPTSGKVIVSNGWLMKQNLDLKPSKIIVPAVDSLPCLVSALPFHKGPLRSIDKDLLNIHLWQFGFFHICFRSACSKSKGIRISSPCSIRQMDLASIKQTVPAPSPCRLHQELPTYRQMQ